VLVGGRRHLDLFPEHPGEKVPLESPLSEAVELIGRISRNRRMAVLASGDPLFFGIGGRLSQAFGKERLFFIPNVTSLQVLCARICRPWGDVEAVSMHGRPGAAPIGDIVEKLKRGGKIAVFTDPSHTPAWIAGMLVRSGAPGCEFVVAEDLGGPCEKVSLLPLSEAAAGKFSGLNLVLILPVPRSPADQKSEQVEIFGFKESEFAHEAGLITKMEVRAVALALLRLGPGQILWDIGAGTGSVSIEASRIAPLGRVFAVEKNESRHAMLLENLEKFGATGIEAVCGGAPEALEGLPDPDRVFIGGSGEALDEILDEVCGRILPGGVVVQTVVLLETLERVRRFWNRSGWEVSVTQLQVSRSVPTGKDLRLEALNPVFIVSSRRR
jgi:precorrin-6Y C5,15-methyltransferase (decarboxylating)